MKNKSRLALNISVSVSFLMYLAYFFIPYLYPYFYDDSVLKQLFLSPVEPIYTTTNEDAWLFLGAHFFSFFMVLKRAACAKYVYLLVVILGFFITAVSGMVMYTEIDSILSTLIAMADAIALYVMFFELPRSKESPASVLK